MVAGIWKTAFKKERANELIQFANQVSKPYLSGREGNRGAYFLSDGVDWITLTLWAKESDIEAMERAPEYADVVSQLYALDVLSGKSETRVYHLH